jgi:two-component system nitrogen regulation response regulator NtrX
VVDIPEFVTHFLAEFSRETAREALTVSHQAKEALLRYPWPGNVRELKNLIERLVIMTPSKVITLEDSPTYIRGAKTPRGGGLFGDALLKEARRNFEKEFILRKLKEFEGNIARTAEAIGIERSHLYRKIKSYGIEHEDL